MQLANKNEIIDSYQLQIFFGTRLPIIQSGSFLYFAVVKGILSKETCKDLYHVIDENGSESFSRISNVIFSSPLLMLPCFLLSFQVKLKNVILLQRT
jgi:hypothetical protein